MPCSNSPATSCWCRFLISLITASFLYFALQWVIVRPVRRLTGNIADFSSNPEDASRVIRPTDRGDEIGLAEQALAQMETTLADELRQKRRLAELGLAVSKINHELRNMLTTAHLLTDRLDRVERRSGPAGGAPPRRHARPGHRLLRDDPCLWPGRGTAAAAADDSPCAPRSPDLANLTDLAPGASGSSSRREVPDELMVDADEDQLSRVLVNLVRNAVQALSQAGRQRGHAADRRVRGLGRALPWSSASRDNGPGIPERLRADLFTPVPGLDPQGRDRPWADDRGRDRPLHGGTITPRRGRQREPASASPFPDRQADGRHAK